MINLIGIGWIIHDIGNVWNPPEYKEQVSILEDSRISHFDGSTFLTLKVRNNAPVRIRSLAVGVNVYDTNDIPICVTEDYIFSTIEPKEERYVSARVSFRSLNQEDYRLEPFIAGAHTYYDD